MKVGEAIEKEKAKELLEKGKIEEIVGVYRGDGTTYSGEKFKRYDIYVITKDGTWHRVITKPKKGVFRADKGWGWYPQIMGDELTEILWYIFGEYVKEKAKVVRL